MNNKSFPVHMRRVYGTPRGYRALKRRQLRNVLVAWDDFLNGSAYLPPDVWKAVRDADNALVTLKGVFREQVVR